MVFIRSSIFKNVKILNYQQSVLNVSDVKHDFALRTELPEDIFSIYYNGKLAHPFQRISNDAHIEVCFGLPGGKGGFGSMLRAIGAQIEKTTNREACRDLSGRRLRDINEEERLKRWLAKKAEREVEQLKRRKEKLERMKAQPKHEFHDPNYNKERTELQERIDDALSQGLKKSSILSKKHPTSGTSDAEPPLKKQRAWLDDEVLSDSEDSHSDPEEPTLGEYSQANSSDSIDISNSSSSNQDSNDASISQLDKSIKKFHTENSQTEESSDNTLNKLESLEDQDAAKTEDNENEHIANNLTQEHNESSLNQSENSSNNVDVKNNEKEDDTLDLLHFETVAQLEALGMDGLKASLMKLGLKCGGTLSERASRLWSVRGLDPNDYPRSLRAKSSKS